uniref:RING-type domain-containing protein n=1 Tax=Macrostomum lignano TaxID=282301 RepID=A0A1I8HHW5_9PLAT
VGAAERQPVSSSSQRRSGWTRAIPGVEKLSKMSAAGAGSGQAGLEKCFFCDTTVYAAERRTLPAAAPALRMSAFARDPETRRFLCPSHHAEVLADLETRSIVMRWLEAHHGGGGLGEEGLAAKAGHLYLSPDEADGLMSAPGAAAAPMSPSSVTSASVSSQPSGSPSAAAGGGGGDGNPLGFAEDQVEKVVLRGSESSEEGASKKDRRRLSGGAAARQHRRHHHPLSEEATSSSHGQLGPADFRSDEASSCEEDFEAAAAAAGLGDSEDRDNVFAMDAAKELQIRALMEARLLKRPKKSDRQVREDNQSTSSSSEAAAAAAVAAQDEARVKLLQAMEITRRWNQTAPEPSGESLNAGRRRRRRSRRNRHRHRRRSSDRLGRLRHFETIAQNEGVVFFSQESKGLSLHTQFIAQRNLQMLRNSEVDDMPQEVAVDLNLDSGPTKARQLMHQVATPGSSERLDDSFDYVFAEANLHDGNVDTASDEFLASLESARQEIQRRRADREAALDAAELAAGRPHQIKHA